MPRKIRELERELRRAGFRMRPGRGRRRQWEHPLMPDRPVTMSGGPGDDAHRYQYER